MTRWMQREKQIQMISVRKTSKRISLCVSGCQTHLAVLNLVLPIGNGGFRVRMGAMLLSLALLGAGAAGCTPRVQAPPTEVVEVEPEDDIELLSWEEETAAVEETEEAETIEVSLFGNFVAVDSNGNEVTEAIFSSSELTLVYLWGTYSQECREQIGDLAKISEGYPQLQLMGIPLDTLDQSGSASSVQLYELRSIMHEQEAEFLEVLPSFDLVTAVLKDVSSVPVAFFVDGSGRQVGAACEGFLSQEDWQEVIEESLRLLEE